MFTARAADLIFNCHKSTTYQTIIENGIMRDLDDIISICNETEGNVLEMIMDRFGCNQYAIEFIQNLIEERQETK